MSAELVECGHYGAFEFEFYIDVAKEQDEVSRVLMLCSECYMRLLGTIAMKEKPVPQTSLWWSMPSGPSWPWPTFPGV